MTLLLKDDNGNLLPQEVRDGVNNFIDNLQTIPWLKPSPSLKKEDVETQAKFTLECFWVEAEIEYRKITSQEDWAAALASAWPSAWDSAWCRAISMAQALASAQTWAWAITSARISTFYSAWNSSWCETREVAYNSALASEEILLEDNEEFKKKYPNGAFKQLFKLWEMWLYPVWILKDTGKFTIYIPPSSVEFPKDFE